MSRPDNQIDDDKPRSFAWADITAWISALAVLFTALFSAGSAFVFYLSCMNLLNIEKALGFSAVDYVDFKDYVQTIPIREGTVAAIVAFAFFVLGLVDIGICAALFRRSPKEFRRVISITFTGLFLLYVLALGLSGINAGGTLKRDVSNTKPSVVFRKGEQPSVKGRLFLHSGRYIFLWMNDSNSVVAIPNAEVQMIQTPSDFAFASGTGSPLPFGSSLPADSSPSKAITPSTVATPPK